MAINDEGGTISSEVALPRAQEVAANTATSPVEALESNLGAPVGHVVEQSGAVSVVRVSGAVENLENGSPIFQGDALATGENGTVAVLLLDKGQLALGPSSELLIDELVYDPKTQSGAGLFTAVEGLLVYISGDIARASPDAMVLKTPVGTIGIRGTQVGLSIPPDGPVQTVLMTEQGGVVGEIVVQTDLGSVVLNTADSAVEISTGIEAGKLSPIFSRSASDISSLFGGALKVLSAFPDSRGNQYEAGSDDDQGQKSDSDSGSDLAGIDTAAGGSEAGADLADINTAAGAGNGDFGEQTGTGSLASPELSPSPLVGGDTLALTDLPLPAVQSQETVFRAPAFRAPATQQAVTATSTEADGGDQEAFSETLSVTVAPQNTAPIFVSEPIEIRLSEEGLSNSNPDTIGNNDTTNDSIVGGVIVVSDTDGDPISLSLSAPSKTLTSNGQLLVWSGVGSNTLIGHSGSLSGQEVIKVSIDTTGNYSVNLLAPIDHEGNGEDQTTFSFDIMASDGKAQVSQLLTITVEDDAPVVTNANAVYVNDTNVNFTGRLASLGADSEGATISVSGTPTDTVNADGKSITYSISEDGRTLTAMAGSEAAFILSAYDDGTYDFVQLKQLSTSDIFTSDFSKLSGEGRVEQIYMYADGGFGSDENAGEVVAVIAATESDQTIAEVNTSAKGFGVDNGNVEKGETIIFDPLSDTVTALNLSLNSGQIPDYNALIYLVDEESPVSLGNLNSSEFTYSAPAGAAIDKVVIEAGDKSSFKVSFLQFFEASTSTNIDLEFSFTVTDGDGDETQRNLKLTASSSMSLSGTSNEDVIAGGIGDDFLTGGAGDDILFGGLGSDVLSGGEGLDTYYVNDSNGLSDNSSDRVIIGDLSTDVESADWIFGFDLENDVESGGDILDLSAFVSEAESVQEAIDNGTISFAEDGAGNTAVFVDVDGIAGGQAAMVAAVLHGVSSSTEEQISQLQAHIQLG